MLLFWIKEIDILSNYALSKMIGDYSYGVNFSIYFWYSDGNVYKYLTTVALF